MTMWVGWMIFVLLQFQDVPVYAEGYTAERLQRRMPYCFVEHPYPGVPSIPLSVIEPYKPFQVTNLSGHSLEVVSLE